MRGYFVRLLGERQSWSISDVSSSRARTCAGVDCWSIHVSGQSDDRVVVWDVARSVDVGGGIVGSSVGGGECRGGIGEEETVYYLHGGEASAHARCTIAQKIDYQLPNYSVTKIEDRCQL